MRTIDIKIQVNEPDTMVTIDDTGGSTKQLQRGWRNVQDMLPKSDDETVIVCTKDMAIYVSRTIGGKFFKDIAFWMPIPMPPKVEK